MRILFIAWDGPYVSYLEGLFLPLFAGLKKHGYDFHILHFSWADPSVLETVSSACREKGIPYSSMAVGTRPHPVIGKFFALLRARSVLVRYVKVNKIDAVMPRALMPSQMILRAVRKMPALKVIFDADGLPIEERLDFTGLRKGSLRYNQLKKIEGGMISAADVVLARSSKAIEFLVSQFGEDKRAKMFKVINGREESLFRKSDESTIQKLRQSLGIPPDAFVLVYCGSLGPQYGTDQMAWIHQRLLKANPGAYWLILTGNPGYFSPEQLEAMHQVVIKKVPAPEVPKYLSVAQAGFALRKATFSMRGVAPVKLGEYLLLGLPVIASAGIGDTEEILRDKSFCFLLKDFEEENLEQAVNWLLKPDTFTHSSEARSCGEECFGLTRAVESYRLAFAGTLSS